MVDLQAVGTTLTLILVTISVFISAIALQEDGNEFGFSESINNLAIGNDTIEGMIEEFNDDFNAFSNSDGLNQIPLGAKVIITGARNTLQFFVLGAFGWVVIVDLMFGFTTEPALLAFGLVIKAIFGVIMVITIAGYLGGIIRSLPFFGGG